MSFFDFVDAEIEALQQIVPLPQEPLNYGTDLSCVSDLTADMAETDPESVQGVGEMLVRFLTSDRDSIDDAPGRGFNIYALLAKGQSPDDIRSAQSAISNEATEDDRIESATCTLEIVSAKALNVRLFCVPSDLLDAPPFSLIIAIDGAGLSFEIIQGAAA